jgi:hypothetical protein
MGNLGLVRVGCASGLLALRRVLGLLALAGFVVLAGGCASGGAIERWQLFEPAAASAQTHSDSVDLVFYRELPAGRQFDRPINVYIDGHYLGSLVGNAYVRAQLCPGEHRLAVALEDVQRRYLTKDEGLPFKVDAASARYFKVAVTEGGLVTLTAVPQTELTGGVSSLASRQSHAVPRLAKVACTSPR